MNEREAEALSALKQSKKYAELCEATVERVFTEELTRHKRLKEAEKSARARLHQITGAFMTPAHLALARGCLEAYAQGDLDALARALKLHASTAERLPAIEDLYGRVFERVGRPAMILDLACGLNPLYLGSKGLCVRGHDISGGITGLIDGWAARCAWDVSARTTDLTMNPSLEHADLALAMKLLPVIEQQHRGAAMALLLSVPARHILVSFPTHTLSGRGVGMERNYTRWFEDNLPENFEILDRFVLQNELCYLTEANNG